jgi:hypothetical protein
MKRHLPRLLLVLASLGALALTAGCAGFAEGLSQVANEMERQQQQSPYGDPYYHQPANASAPGIK